MAAMGQEAAAMDSISRAPPSVLQLRSDTDSGAEPGHEEASENVAPAPRRPTNNSKLMNEQDMLARYMSPACSTIYCTSITNDFLYHVSSEPCLVASHFRDCIYLFIHVYLQLRS